MFWLCWKFGKFLILYANNFNLQFADHLDNRSIDFLDVTLFSIEDHIESRLYRKPFSGNNLLRADSGYPSHLTCGILVGQFLRLRRVCSEEGDFQQEKKDMCERFIARGYKPSTLNRAQGIVEATPRQHLLTHKKNRPGLFNTLNFSTPFSMEFNKIRRIIERHILILFEDECYGKILVNSFKTVSRRAPSLAKSLSPSDFSSRTWLDFTGTFKCGKIGWPCSSRVIQRDTFIQLQVRGLSKTNPLSIVIPGILFI